MTADLLALAEALTVAVAKLRRARMQTKASKSLTRVVGAGFKVQQVAVLKALAGYRTRWPIVPVEESAALREASVDPMTVALVNALTASGMPLQEAIETAAGQMFVDAAKLQATLFDFNPDTAWTLKHPQAVEYVKFAGANAITNINDTTRKGIQDLIEQAVEDGWSYNQTAGAIRQYFDGFTAPQPQKHIPDRATLVAVTECLVGDTLVSLGSLPGTVRSLPDPVPFALGVGLRAGTLTESPILWASRRWYVGPMVNITTASGYKLTGTPNHPILTDRGWVGLGSLQEGDNVICDHGFKHVALGDPDVEHRPAEIREIFDTLRNASDVAPERVVGCDMDFHGDGMQGEVDIVWASRDLWQEHIAALSKPVDHHLLPVSNLRPGALTESSASSVGRFRIFRAMAHSRKFGHAALSCGVCIAQRVATLIRASLSPHDATRFGLVPHGDVVPNESSSDQVLGDAVPTGNALASLPANVGADHIVNIEWSTFSGHVYNLHTGSQHYMSNGIITHNCGNAYEAGSRALIDEMAAAGFEMQKSWLTVGDERTSEACLGNAAAGWIAYDESFPSGHQQPLEHPGCRCTCLHRRKPTPR